MTHLSTRGHQYKIFKQHARKLTRINSFANRIVNDWNALPSEVVESPSINMFKKKLDDYWINYAYNSPFKQYM